MNYKNKLSMRLIGISLIAGTCHAQIDDPLEEIKSCARMPNHEARSACYESLGQRALEEEVPVRSVPLIVDTNQSPQVEVVAAELAEVLDQPVVEEVTEEVVEGVAAVMPAAESLPDDLGGREFSKDSELAENQNRERITSCRKDLRDKWSFYFENGQVWKQVDSRRRRFRDCDFMATITRDTFGYKMQIDGKKERIRVSRKN